jgi:carboxylesterase type B
VRSAQAEDHTTVTHSSELTFVFSSVQDEAEYGSTSVEELSEPVRLADMVVAYFTNFAKTGDPNGVSDLGQVRKHLFLRHLILKMRSFYRARDKHR